MRMMKMLLRTLFTKEGTAVKHKSFEVLRRHDVKEQTGCATQVQMTLMGPQSHPGLCSI
ncbi:hypothetical protein BofuT4_uP062760.1 [Botrytis cinerea T4]|uniref:Uncharacterized protein n=1 Tax=Botryotinia fuckeliana (strain T4) TaxID=999810 RepID=G2XTL0_BOTF4|nr:hypothetical protein BofuT4_uP062760.1 [Botrytis cinerea T4]